MGGIAAAPVLLLRQIGRIPKPAPPPLRSDDCRLAVIVGWAGHLGAWWSGGVIGAAGRKAVARFCHASRRLRWSARRELFRSCDLHDADRDASVMEEVTASVGCRNVLVVTGSAA